MAYLSTYYPPFGENFFLFRMSQKKLLLPLFLLCVFITLNGKAENPVSPINYEDVANRLKDLPCLIKPKDTPVVRSYIRTYMETRRRHAEVILGRTVLYFPMFEEKFREHEMPTDLKYLSIVESALRPKALSRVGAGGLWQFMPETGKYYGLDINEHRDDRSDPAMATEAAIAYLKDAHRRFQSWELAIASYNSGPGRVNRAIRRSRSKNFWKLKRYLPRETRSYVPGFIAATYLCKYYADHGLTPSYPSLDMQLTQTVQIFEHLSFTKIQNLTGLSRYVIEDLNPAYNYDYIPANSKGYTLTLPKRVMQSVLDYLAHIRRPDSGKNRGAIVSAVTITPKPVKANTQDEYYKSVYYVHEGESLARIADIFGVTINNLIAWNSLSIDSELYAGQEITLFHPNKIERWSPRKEVKASPVIPSLEVRPLVVEDISNPKDLRTKAAKVKIKGSKKSAKKKLKLTDKDPTDIRGRTIFYTVQKGESLQDIADRFAGVRLEDLYELNKIKEGKPLKPGLKLKIKKL